MNKSFYLVVVMFTLAGLAASAAPLAEGDPVPVITANDQHGAPFTLTTNVQFLLVVTEMDAAKAANKKLAEQGTGFLEKHNAAYLMDIHTMPAIGRWFAIPKMQKYPQRIILIDSASALTNFPAQANCVTVMALTPAGRVQKVRYWNPASEPVDGCFAESAK